MVDACGNHDGKPQHHRCAPFIPTDLQHQESISDYILPSMAISIRRFQYDFRIWDRAVIMHQCRCILRYSAALPMSSAGLND